jgi:hypothetical protein
MYSLTWTNLLGIWSSKVLVDVLKLILTLTVFDEESFLCQMFFNHFCSPEKIMLYKAFSVFNPCFVRQKKNHFEESPVVDESDFWQHRDVERLVQAVQLLEKAIQG